MEKRKKAAFQEVTNAATEAADNFNKLGKEAERMIKGKTPTRKRIKKIVTLINEMKTTMIYLGLDDKRMYRRVGDELQVMNGGNWESVRVTAGFLNEMKFREY